jgi:hypothetical protein
VPYEVHNFPHALCETWSRFPQPDPSSTTTWTHVDLLAHIRDIVCKRPLASEQKLVTWGTLFVELDALRTDLGRVQESMGKRTAAKKKENAEAEEAWGKLTVKSPKTTRKQKKEEQERLIGAQKAVLKRLEEAEAPISEKKQAPNTDQLQFSALLSLSPLARVRVGSSGSAKLDYIIDEVSLSENMFRQFIHYHRYYATLRKRSSSSSRACRCRSHTSKMLSIWSAYLVLSSLLGSAPRRENSSSLLSRHRTPIAFSSWN